MTNNLSRLEKIAILKGAAAGKPLEALLPKLQISFVEDELAWYTTLVDNHSSANSIISVSQAKSGELIEALREQNPGKILLTHYIDNARYQEISERLENEY